MLLPLHFCVSKYSVLGKYDFRVAELTVMFHVRNACQYRSVLSYFMKSAKGHHLMQIQTNSEPIRTTRQKWSTSELDQSRIQYWRHVDSTKYPACVCGRMWRLKTRPISLWSPQEQQHPTWWSCFCHTSTTTWTTQTGLSREWRLIARSMFSVKVSLLMIAFIGSIRELLRDLTECIWSVMRT